MINCYTTNCYNTSDTRGWRVRPNNLKSQLIGNFNIHFKLTHYQAEGCSEG